MLLAHCSKVSVLTTRFSRKKNPKKRITISWIRRTGRPSRPGFLVCWARWRTSSKSISKVKEVTHCRLSKALKSSKRRSRLATTSTCKISSLIFKRNGSSTKNRKRRRIVKNSNANRPKRMLETSLWLPLGVISRFPLLVFRPSNRAWSLRSLRRLSVNFLCALEL